MRRACYHPIREVGTVRVGARADALLLAPNFLWHLTLESLHVSARDKQNRTTHKTPRSYNDSWILKLHYIAPRNAKYHTFGCLSNHIAETLERIYSIELHAIQVAKCDDSADSSRYFKNRYLIKRSFFDKIFVVTSPYSAADPRHARRLEIGQRPTVRTLICSKMSVNCIDDSRRLEPTLNARRVSSGHSHQMNRVQLHRRL
jgi:hypothetical protein